MENPYTTVTMALPHLIREVLSGAEITSRNGLTKELLHTRIVIQDPCRREQLAALRKASFPAQIAETMWVLAGRNDVEWLSRYLPRAAEFSDDGISWRGGYGPRLRGGVDQLSRVINLLRADPGTRRAVVSLLDPAIDDIADPGIKDIPCNDWLHFISREGKLDLHIATRSNDLMWGWSGINTFEWASLLELVSAMTGQQVGSLVFSISSLHLYGRHFAKAEKIMESGVDRVEDASPPTLMKDMSTWSLEDLDREIGVWLQEEEAIRTGLPYDVSRVGNPLWQEWLVVLAAYWKRDDADTDTLSERAKAALAFSPRRGREGEFIEAAILLHNEKSAAYGDSWCRRGREIGILANIARKVDRLGGGLSTKDENRTDTAMDLMIYTAKYLSWLRYSDGGIGTSHEEDVAAILRVVSKLARKSWSEADLVDALVRRFDTDIADSNWQEDTLAHRRLVHAYLLVAFSLAYRWWLEDTVKEEGIQVWMKNNASRMWKGDSL